MKISKLIICSIAIIMLAKGITEESNAQSSDYSFTFKFSGQILHLVTQGSYILTDNSLTLYGNDNIQSDLTYDILDNILESASCGLIVTTNVNNMAKQLNDKAWGWNYAVFQLKGTIFSYNEPNLVQQGSGGFDQYDKSCAGIHTLYVIVYAS